MRPDNPYTAVPDIPVLPHYLAPMGEQRPDVFNNFALRVGEVVELVYPDDPRSLSKKVLEYRVLIQHLDNDLAATGRIYPHCVLLNPFGGVADKVSWTFRADPGRKDETGLGKGSKVLVLCVNGEHNSAVIIGGVRDEKDNQKTSKEQEHHFFAVFNGVKLTVTRDGEFSFIRQGPTDIDGKVLDGTPSDAQTSGLIVFQNGSIALGAANSRDGDMDQVITIDQPARQIKMKAGSGVHVGQATDEWPLFATYRRAEQQLHSTLVSLLTSATALIATMAEGAKAAAVLHVIPIVGPILAAPAIGSVGVQLTAIMALIQSAINAINTFEGSAASYLSKLNKND